MPAELPDFFARYYSKPGATYIDPFAGQGVQMQVANLLGMNYVGMDACAEYIAYSHAVLDRIDTGSRRIEVHLGDSRHPVDQLEDSIGDFCFTSPPYWDIEYYGPEAEQLGTGQTYQEFLDGLKDVFVAWLPKFKSGAYIAVNVNDIRRESTFIPYHADVIRLLSQAGYRLRDTWIVEGLISGLPRAFGVSFNMQRIAPKVHEYVLIAQAP